MFLYRFGSLCSFSVWFVRVNFQEDSSIYGGPIGVCLVLFRFRFRVCSFCLSYFVFVFVLQLSAALCLFSNFPFRSVSGMFSFRSLSFSIIVS